jgi:hypothetical protein
MRRFFALAACLLRASQAGAASFDCAKASTPVETTICGDPALAAAEAAGPRPLRHQHLLAVGEISREIVGAAGPGDHHPVDAPGDVDCRYHLGCAERLDGAVDQLRRFGLGGVDGMLVADRRPVLEARLIDLADHGLAAIGTEAPRPRDVRTGIRCASKPKQKTCRDRGP